MSNGPATLPTHERLMFLRSRLVCKRPRRTTLFVVPWINIVMLLFAFYIVQSQRVLSPGLVLSLPAAPFTGGAPADSEVVTVLRNGAIFFHDERVAIENLAPALRKNGGPASHRSLLIEADGDVTHRLLADVYNAAQQAAYSNVVLATRLPETAGPAHER
jgi:biopolymer transport protein ExbD